MEFYDYFSKTTIKPKELSKKEYPPKISNEQIGLLSSSGTEDISSSPYLSFDIIKNDTLERIGRIGFHTSNLDELFYGGNIDYTIYERFRNQGYGTESLALLKKALKENPYAIKDGLLISTVPENIYFQKIAIKNGGILIYEGEVPKDNLLYQLDHVKDVKVYKITMNRK